MPKHLNVYSCSISIATTSTYTSDAFWSTVFLGLVILITLLPPPLKSTTAHRKVMTCKKTCQRLAVFMSTIRTIRLDTLVSFSSATSNPTFFLADSVFRFNESTASLLRLRHSSYKAHTRTSASRLGKCQQLSNRFWSPSHHQLQTVSVSRDSSLYVTLERL